MSTRTVIDVSENAMSGGSTRSAPEVPLAHAFSRTRTFSVATPAAGGGDAGSSHQVAVTSRDSTSPFGVVVAVTAPFASRLSTFIARFDPGHHAAHQPSPLVAM